jgi:hypothetical protein
MCPWVAGSSPRCGAMRRMGALVVIGFYTLDQPGAEVGEFSFAHSADVAQRFLGCWPDAGQLAERRVVQDDECGDAAFNGYFAAERAQFFEEGFVHVLPRVLLNFGSRRLGFLCFQQLVVQVNGKVRDRLQIEAGTAEDKVRGMALKSEAVVKHLGGKPPKKVIYVPDKLVSIVA